MEEQKESDREWKEEKYYFCWFIKFSLICFERKERDLRKEFFADLSSSR